MNVVLALTRPWTKQEIRVVGALGRLSGVWLAMAAGFEDDGLANEALVGGGSNFVCERSAGIIIA